MRSAILPAAFCHRKDSDCPSKSQIKGAACCEYLPESPRQLPVLIRWKNGINRKALPLQRSRQEKFRFSAAEGYRPSGL